MNDDRAVLWNDRDVPSRLTNFHCSTQAVYSQDWRRNTQGRPDIYRVQVQFLQNPDAFTPSCTGPHSRPVQNVPFARAEPTSRHLPSNR
ncbi:unnamed protein product [Lota lota]